MTFSLLLPEHLDIEKELLKRQGLKLNSADNKGKTALINGVQKGDKSIVGSADQLLPTGHLTTVCELLKYGDLDITVEDKDGSSALLYAVREGERRPCKIRGDISASDHTNIFKELAIWKGSTEWTPLPWAAS